MTDALGVRRGFSGGPLGLESIDTDEAVDGINILTNNKGPSVYT